MQNLRRVGKSGGPVGSRLWTKVHVVLRPCRTPLVFVNALPDCLYHVSFRRHRLLKLPLSCKVVQKVVFGLPICRGRRYHRYSTCVFKLHLLPTMWPIFVQRPQRLGGEKRKKKRRRNTGKIYVRRHTMSGGLII